MSIESQLPPPVLPDEEPMLTVPDEVETQPVADVADDGSGAPRRRRGPAAAAQPRPLSEAESDKWDYDSWITSFDWDQPGMQCKVERIAPEMVGTVMTAGVCGVFDNIPLTTRQIQQQFGGGRYHVSVIGPRMSKKTNNVKIMRLSHKPLKIPGDPNLDNLGRIGLDNAAEVARNRGSHGGGGSGGNNDQVVRLLGDMIQPLQRRVDSAGQQGLAATQMIGQQFETAANLKIKAAQDMLAEKDRMVAMQMQQANIRADEARKEAELARQEKEKALAEARAAQERIWTERAAMEEAFSKKLQSVQGDSNMLISTLLPATQQQAQAQINTMMNLFESRLASQEASYSSRLDNLDRSYQQRMQAQADLFRTQMESASQLYQGQIQHLQLQLQTTQSEKQLLITQLEDARNRLMEEVTRLNKATDPEEQLSKLGSLLETVKGITGMTGGGEEEKPSSGNPFFDGIMANVGKLAEVVPHITGAIAAKAQADVAQAQFRSQPPPQQQAMVPMQQAMPQQMLAQPMEAPGPAQAAPRRVVRRPQPAQPKPAAKPKGKIDRAELDTAITYINSALSSNPNLDPVDYASMAIAAVDNDMLRRLSRQKSELVVNELETMGVLHGNVATDQGKEWLCRLLDALRAKL